VLGALKMRLAKHSIDFATSPPMTVEGRDLSLHASIGGPSLLLTLRSDVGPVSVELCLRTFDPASLERNVPVRGFPSGEVIFL
jgi:CheY-specific phosphatase CheX